MSKNGKDRPEILIVDDDEAVRDLLVAILCTDYTCFTAISGEDAIGLIGTHLPDLVISDIKMPGISGLELIPKIFELSPDIVVMMISGNQMIDTAIEAIHAGAFDYIKKPFEIDHVEMAVQRALDHRALLLQKRKHDEHLEELVVERTKQLHQAAYYDTLSGLPNRRLFDDRLVKALRHNNADYQAAVMLVSPDRFKDLRDTLGHSSGAQILKELAERLSGCIQGENTLARFEGDEFAVLMPGIAGIADVTVMTNMIFDALQAPFAVGSHEIVINAAIGVSLYPRDGEDGQSLVKNAGAALSRAKSCGINTYHFYTADMHAEAVRRLTFEIELRQALEKGELEAYYQPKVRNSDGCIVGTEALMRWRNPVLGLVSPLDFIPIAEENGMMAAIGEWILREACRQTKAWQDAGFGLHVAVNVSAVQFDMTLADTVRKIIAETGLDGVFLNLEMTESAVMKDPEYAIATLNELKKLGIQISVDDFGTGYSSLAHLKRLPIDVLKIDKSFINDVTTDPDAASLVMSVVGLAHNLRLAVVAEGVETEEQLRLLNLLRCDEWQGFLMSEPLPAVDLLKLLRKKGTVPSAIARQGNQKRPTGHFVSEISGEYAP